MEKSETALFDVEQSLCGRFWEAAEIDDKLGRALCQTFSLPAIVGQVLAARGITPEIGESFLSPTLRGLLPDPSLLADMDKAADRIAGAVMAGETIGLFGDYDVDGATSAAVLARFLHAAGGQTIIHIPDRLKEGYGPNLEAFLKMQARGVGLVVTLDCGITAFEPMAGAAEAGLEVVVVDHHAAEPQLPDAFAVVNPNRLDDDSPCGSLAAVGVAFLVVVAVNRRLRLDGWYERKESKITEPDLLSLLDLVALGTVCDVVPLVDLNRAFVTQGIKVMDQGNNAGLRALAAVAGISGPPGVYHAGFVLGPRINAGGRVGDASLGTRLLLTEDYDEAMAIASRLEKHNQERRDLEDRCFAEAVSQVEGMGDDYARDGYVYVSSVDWHPGVIGIVASRLRERYGVPACVVSEAGDVGKGSGRSIAGVDLGAAVIAARQSGLLVNGGGHSMAAGFTVAKDQEPAFQAFLTERLAEGTAEARVQGRSLRIDGVLDPGGVTTGFARHLERLGPFGSGNREPVFVLPAVPVAHARLVGRNNEHVSCRVGGAGRRTVQVIAFRSASLDHGRALSELAGSGTPLHIAGHVRISEWMGQTRVQLSVVDVARVENSRGNHSQGNQSSQG